VDGDDDRVLARSLRILGGPETALPPVGLHGRDPPGRPDRLTQFFRDGGQRPRECQGRRAFRAWCTWRAWRAPRGRGFPRPLPRLFPLPRKREPGADAGPDGTGDVGRDMDVPPNPASVPPASARSRARIRSWRNSLLKKGTSRVRFQEISLFRRKWAQKSQQKSELRAVKS